MRKTSAHRRQRQSCGRIGGRPLGHAYAPRSRRDQPAAVADREHDVGADETQQRPAFGRIQVRAYARHAQMPTDQSVRLAIATAHIQACAASRRHDCFATRGCSGLAMPWPQIQSSGRRTADDRVRVATHASAHRHADGSLDAYERWCALAAQERKRSRYARSPSRGRSAGFSSCMAARTTDGATSSSPQRGVARSCCRGECPRICVGLNERDVHAYNQRKEVLRVSE